MIEELRREIPHTGPHTVLDLAQIDIVDIESVRFLRECQDRNIELRNCALYISEWIRRERLEG
jgi:hypothetical protein